MLFVYYNQSITWLQSRESMFMLLVYTVCVYGQLTWVSDMSQSIIIIIKLKLYHFQYQRCNIVESIWTLNVTWLLIIRFVVTYVTYKNIFSNHHTSILLYYEGHPCLPYFEATAVYKLMSLHTYPWNCF
jgi:hypothetical protein